MAEDFNLIVEALSPIEREVLPLIEKDGSVEDIVKDTGKDKTTILRAVNFLKNKGLVETREEQKKEVILGVNGIFYKKKGLPERKLLNFLGEKKSILIGEVKNIGGLNENEAKAAIGVLKKKALAKLSNGRILLDVRKEEITKKMLEETLLEALPKDVDSLEPEEKFAFEALKKRKDIVQVEDEKKVFVSLTELGEKVSKMDLEEDMIEQLTPKILKGNSWKGKKFRRYDLTTAVPRVYGGKRHFVNQATEYAKSIWLEMGFKEMEGDLVDSGFWVFDALFTAQDHPVREEQDTFFIDGVEAKLPRASDKKAWDVVEEVKKAHEGGIDDSKGWQYDWKEEEAKKVLLRTHTTCLSVRTMKEIAKNLENNVPAKYFALGKVFRNETVDWSHGFEFNQTEGIVVDENANFRQLLGYLKEFYKKMGYDKIRVRPGYFAYTEPSLEIDVWNKERKKWVELGGAGMFRPEVTIPIFGRHIPVLAWGQGFDRIITGFFEIKDLREMYKNDLTKLRRMKFWRK